MEIITGKSLMQLPFQDDLIRIGDLIYFDGPLLTLFEDSKSDDLYLFDWADRDERFNRWLIYRSTPELLSKFIQKAISYQEFFHHAVKSGLYSVDIDSKLAYHNIKLIDFQHLLEVYQPEAASYFDENDAPAFKKIKNFIDKYVERNKQLTALQMAARSVQS